MKRIYTLIVLGVFFTNILYSQIYNPADSIKTGPPVREITITSQRFEKKLDEISLPLEIITTEKIKNSPAVTISDLLKLEGGVALTRDGIWATGVTIRGLSRSSIVTLVDGNRIETATDLSAGLSLINIDDIERIEIVKGASSVLYGTGAIGGVVNIFSRQGRYNENAFVNGSLSGSFNSVNKQGTGSIYVLAGSKDWYAKLFTNMRSADNIKTPSGEIPNSRFRDRSFSSVVAFRPQTGNEIKLNYQYFSATDAGIPGGSTLFPSAASVRYTDIDREMLSAEYKISNLFKSLNLFSVKYYFQNIARYVENIPYQTTTIPASGTTPAKRVSVLKITPNARHYTQGMQLQTDWIVSENNYLIAGLDVWKRTLDSKREKYQKIEVLNSSNFVVGTTNKIIGERPVPESDFRNIGFFVDDEIKLIENKLTINAGARFDGIKVTNKKTYNPVYDITNGVISYTPAGQALNWDEKDVDDYSWSGSIGAVYFLLSDLDITLNLSRSFRSPSLEERYQYIDLGSLLRIGKADLKPEDGYFVDLGIRFWGNNFNFRVNGFYNYIKDMIVEIPGTYQNRAALIKTNSGKAQLYGFDFSTEYKIIQNISVYGTGSYVRGKDAESSIDLPQIPPLNGSIGVKAEIDEIIKMDLSAVLFAEQNKIAAGEVTTPGYTYFNFMAGSYPIDFNFTKISLSAGIENIFDISYRNHLSSNRGLILSEPGRNIFVKLQIDW